MSTDYYNSAFKNFGISYGDKAGDENPLSRVLPFYPKHPCTLVQDKPNTIGTYNNQSENGKQKMSL